MFSQTHIFLPLCPIVGRLHALSSVMAQSPLMMVNKFMNYCCTIWCFYWIVGTFRAQHGNRDVLSHRLAPSMEERLALVTTNTTKNGNWDELLIFLDDIVCRWCAHLCLGRCKHCQHVIPLFRMTLRDHVAHHASVKLDPTWAGSQYTTMVAGTGAVQCNHLRPSWYWHRFGLSMFIPSFKKPRYVMVCHHHFTPLGHTGIVPKGSHMALRRPRSRDRIEGVPNRHLAKVTSSAPAPRCTLSPDQVAKICQDLPRCREASILISAKSIRSINMPAMPTISWLEKVEICLQSQQKSWGFLVNNSVTALPRQASKLTFLFLGSVTVHGCKITLLTNKKWERSSETMGTGPGQVRVRSWTGSF